MKDARCQYPTNELSNWREINNLFGWLKSSSTLWPVPVVWSPTISDRAVASLLSALYFRFDFFSIFKVSIAKNFIVFHMFHRWFLLKEWMKPCRDLALLKKIFQLSLPMFRHFKKCIGVIREDWYMYTAAYKKKLLQLRKGTLWIVFWTNRLSCRIAGGHTAGWLRYLNRPFAKWCHAAYQNALPDHCWIKLVVYVQVYWMGGSLDRLWGVLCHGSILCEQLFLNEWLQANHVSYLDALSRSSLFCRCWCCSCTLSITLVLLAHWHVLLNVQPTTVMWIIVLFDMWVPSPVHWHSRPIVEKNVTAAIVGLPNFSYQVSWTVKLHPDTKVSLSGLPTPSALSSYLKLGKRQSMT